MLSEGVCANRFATAASQFIAETIIILTSAELWLQFYSTLLG